MASESNLSPMPQFQPQSDPTNTEARWTAWLERFETYIIAAGVTEEERKRALLLYQAGPEVYKIFKTLPDTGDNKDYTKAKDALTKHFEQAKNPIYEIYNFCQANQRDDETIAQFHTRLRTLAQHCDVYNTDFEIKMQLVCNGTSSRLRSKAFRDPNYKLEDMLIDGRKAEVTSTQAPGIEETFQALQINDAGTRNSCYKCGFSFPHQGKPYPAKQAICCNSGVKGHFAKVLQKTHICPPKPHHPWTPRHNQNPAKS